MFNTLLVPGTTWLFGSLQVLLIAVFIDRTLADIRVPGHGEYAQVTKLVELELQFSTRRCEKVFEM